MAAQKNATYKVDNGTDWDEYNFKTIAKQVKMASGVDLELGFEADKNPIGYSKLPNGLLIQWGTLSSTLEARFKNVDIVFPKMFSGGVKVFLNCDWLSGTTSPANMQCNSANLTNSKFTATFKVDDTMFATNQFSAQWFAIGY